MSEMPTKIKIFHTVWWIIEADKDEMEEEYKECLGYTDHIKQYIYIAADQSEENKKTTLFHEILHACIGLSDIKPKKLKKKTEIEHAYIGALEYSLINIIQQNPKLIEYLKGEK